MTLKNMPGTGTKNRRSLLSLAAMLQAATLLFVGLAASAQETNRLQDIQIGRAHV